MPRGKIANLPSPVSKWIYLQEEEKLEKIC